MNPVFRVVQLDDKILFLSLPFSPPPSHSLYFLRFLNELLYQKVCRKASVECISSIDHRMASAAGVRLHRREKNPDERRKCCRFFKILSSASSSTLLHPLISGMLVFASRFMDENLVLETEPCIYRDSRDYIGTRKSLASLLSLLAEGFNGRMEKSWPTRRKTKGEKNRREEHGVE